MVMGTTGSEPPTAELFLFGPFALDGYARTLVSHDLAVPLQPKTLELLEYLVRNGGRLITHAEILDAVWPGEELTEGNLTQQMLLLRGTLARYSPRETFVVAEPEQGYRFVAHVVAHVVARAAPGSPDDPEVERLFARGRYFYEKRTADSLHRSVHYFRQAIERDPMFARAYAGLASAFALSGEYLLLGPTSAFPRAADAARRALALDPTLAGAHTALAEVACHYDRDMASAQRHNAQAAALAPGSIHIAVFRAWFSCIVGRADEAADALRLALAAEPYSLILQTTLAVAAVFARRYDDAIAQLRAALEMDADYVHARFYLAIALQLDGRDEEVVALTGASVPDGYEQQFLALRGCSLARLGRSEEARAADDALRALSSRGRYVSCFNLAWIAIGAGEFDHAIGLLEAGFPEHDPWLVFIPHYPLLDPLRGKSRFQALILRVESGFDDSEIEP
jgi:DNA-binding winged helix-turn-helix (wHTH) protein/tetratricopeptide (TPR) repeat protein